jgi:nitronate monooxygenase
MWLDRRLLDLLKIEHPIIQAPMAGAMDADLVVAVSEAGGLGSLPCGMLNADQIRAQVKAIRLKTQRPFQLNFFCHNAPSLNNARESAWRDRLSPYYAEFAIDPSAPVPSANRAPFDAGLAALVEELRPPIVSFHYGLPEKRLLDRVRAAGCIVIGCATTVAEARAIEEGAADAVIAQGLEAGGHRGMFLSDDLGTQIGTFALVPQIVDAVAIPVIAAGGLGDARGIAAALMLGATAVCIGTAYLFCPEARISPPYRAALATAKDDSTVLTNVFSGRPARGIINRYVREVGPLALEAPDFPLAGGALAPLRAAAEREGSGDFSPMWSGQSAALGRCIPAGELTRALIAETGELLDRLARATVVAPQNAALL